MAPSTSLSLEQLRTALKTYYRLLHERRDDLNRLNVYPVPDGDTGTNMTLTVAAVVEAAAQAETMADLAAAMADGSLMGARGNSGVILAQVFRALAKRIGQVDELDAGAVAAALEEASAAAYRAVQRPAEGTILTVAAAAAEGAAEAGSEDGATVAVVVRRAHARAEEALLATPTMLPVLAEAGVVDAGGAGYLLWLAALLEAVGEPFELPDEVFDAAGLGVSGGAGPPLAGPRFEVMFFLETGPAGRDELERRWTEIGESIVVAGGDGTYNCHVHADDAGAAVEAAVDLGRMRRIRIVDLHGGDGAHPGDLPPLEEYAAAPTGVVAVANGAGVRTMFRDLGAQTVVTGGQGLNPSTGDLLMAVEAVPAADVILLPNNPNVIPAAAEVDALTTKSVRVVPTDSIAAGLAAMVAYLPDHGDLDRLAEMMAEAAAAVRSGELTRAVRDAVVDGVPVAAGDWMGLADGRLCAAGLGVSDVVGGLLDSLVDQSAELVTAIVGDGADPGLTGLVTEWVSARRPGVEVDIVEGGQPLYPLLLMVE